MFLKSLEIFGFKSFAERTPVVFEPGITVIVGPNGCGKSNVVDSIKWVLGEKQARNIRGEKMEDIIFTGTDSRKPLSLAEVSITIDNAHRVLSLDSEEVTVTRRVFRDGESEYLINKSPVRLKDIEELFMDTGLGKSAYSVMEQGRMDLILSTRAEDRRYIFEEAAGISRFKFQKRESLRKLEETSNNLERINDIIREIEREKDLKAKQAEKTKVYLGLMGEFKEYDIRLNFLKYAEQSRRRKKIEDDLERLKKEREELSARVSVVSAENEKDEKYKNDIQLEIFELDKRLHTYRIKVEDIDDRSEKNRTRIEETMARRAAVEKNIAEREDTLARLVEERKKTEQSGVEIRRKIQEDRDHLASIYEMRKKKIQSIHSSRDRIEQNRRQIKENEEALRTLRESLERVIKKLVDAIEKRKAELTGSEEERQRVRARIGEEIKTLENAVRGALHNLELGLVEEVRRSVSSIDLETLKGDIALFESFEDGFRSILFDKTGVHAEKESLDGRIAQTMSSNDTLNADIGLLEEFIRNEQAEVENINGMIMKLEKDLSGNEKENDWIEKHLKSLSHQVSDVQAQIDAHRQDLARSEEAITALRSEIEEMESRLVEFNERSETLRKKIAESNEKRSEIEKHIVDRKDVSRKDTESLNKVNDRIGEMERGMVEIIFRMNSIEEYLWTEYEKKLAELKSVQADDSQLPGIQKNMQDLKKKIQDLGPINNLAIEEFRDLKKRFDYYINQRKDIEKAREDIVSVIQDINKTSMDMFLATFMQIQKNFSEIFKQLFEGGTANLDLTEPENVLESGIEIFVRPPGKKPKSINLLSGGERALTAIALLFATYMVKPSPFCFLDEIDAPLDEENIGRFIRMLQQFAKTSQFVIVTHNKKTMRIGESIYGVTMEEPGVSKVVSLRMEKIEKKVV
jgi:chromosome segregation protein